MCFWRRVPLAIGLVGLVFMAAPLGSPFVRLSAFGAQAQPSVPGTLSVEDADRIKDLKLKALNTTDPQKQLDIYNAILKINPDDPTAITKHDQLQAQIATQAQSTRDHVIAAQDEAARHQLIAEALTAGWAALVEAKRTGEAEPLQRARDQLAKARKYARSGDTDVDRLEKQIAQEASDQRARRIELWAFVGFIVALAVGAIAFVVFRGGRALEMIAGTEPGRVFPLSKETTAIGALAGEVDWAITDPHRKISRRHCEVLRSGRHYFIVDRSTNGTLLNGQRLPAAQAVLLRRGDQIGLAGDILIRFR